MINDDTDIAPKKKKNIFIMVSESWKYSDIGNFIFRNGKETKKNYPKYRKEKNKRKKNLMINMC